MYAALKVIHLGSLVMWLGPALGSWLVLRYMQQQDGELSRATAKVYRVFFWTLTLEHIALVSLLISGATMAFMYGFISMPWLQQKLWLFPGLVAWLLGLGLSVAIALQQLKLAEYFTAASMVLSTGWFVLIAWKLWGTPHVRRA